MSNSANRERVVRSAKLGALMGTLLSAALIAATPAAQAGAQNLKADLGSADLMATPLGLSFAGSKRPWGSSAVLDNPALAQATGVGPQGNLCHFVQTAFRPFNKGEVASGPFKTRVYRNKQLVQHPTFDLQAHEGLTHGAGWYKFDLELPQGKSVIKIVLDSDRVVAESDEGNNVYTVVVDVNFPCGGGIDGFQAELQDHDRPGKGFGKRIKALQRAD